ncbi:unnamed protein product, partial [marine sediment metagenome]
QLIALEDHVKAGGHPSAESIVEAMCSIYSCLVILAAGVEVSPDKIRAAIEQQHPGTHPDLEDPPPTA